jgi:hypothetical protein
MISQWLKPLIEKGVLSWCDEKSHGFMGVADLEKAKRIGQAFIWVADRPCLPSPYQLTGDARWDEDGEYWELYDLGIDVSDPDGRIAGVYVHTDPDARVEEHSETSVPGGGVKAISEKTGSVNNFRDDGLD